MDRFWLALKPLFASDDGQEISAAKRCNGGYERADGTDEHACGSFKCPDRQRRHWWRTASRRRRAPEGDWLAKVQLDRT